MTGSFPYIKKDVKLALSPFLLSKLRFERVFRVPHPDVGQTYCSLPNFGRSEQEHEHREQLYNSKHVDVCHAAPANDH